jgi:hypothetical protein
VPTRARNPCAPGILLQCHLDVSGWFAAEIAAVRRGKSSVTRLIAGGLRAGGRRTLAKTTGTSARLIHGIVGGANGSVELARRGRLRLQGDLAWEIETRDFDARDPNDRIHFGRLDVFNAGEAGLRGVLRRHWSLRGFYRIESNHARLGAPLASSTGPASYRVNQAGIVVEWSGAIWRSAADAAEEEGTP